MQGDSIFSPSGRASRSLNRADLIDRRGRDLIFDVFAEDDSGAESDGLPPSKRTRSSSPPLKVTEDRRSGIIASAGGLRAESTDSGGV